MCQQTVLIIARNTIDYLFAKELLKQYDVSILRAFDSAEALGILTDFGVDMVLIDSNNFLLKEIIEMIEQIKAIDLCLPVVVLSAKPEIEFGLQQTVSFEFLLKPFFLNEFHQLISKYCNVERCVFV
jgi:DNA-binding NtrC family response regulator